MSARGARRRARVRPIGMLTGLALVLVGALGISAGPALAVDTMSAGSPQGNVSPTITSPATTPASRSVAVVAQSAPVDGRVALLLHNGSDQPVRVDLVSAVATRTDGGLAARARTATTYPQVVAPDQLALTSVRFRGASLPAGTAVTAKVRSRAVTAARARQVLSVGDLVLSPPMTGSVAQTMRATVTNPTTAWTARLPEVAVMCFSEASTPTTFASARASTRRVAPGGAASATVPLTSLCPAYLVAARAS